MSFTVRQKEMIRGIGNGSIVDLETCLEIICTSSKKYIDKNEIENKKRIHYNENLEKIDDIMNELAELRFKRSWEILSERIELFKKTLLDYSAKAQSFTLNFTGGTLFNFFNKNIYEIEDDTVFEDYRIVTNYLDSEGLIVLKNENYNATKAQNVRFFCKFKEKKQIKKSEHLGMYLDILFRENNINNTKIRYGYYPQDIDYLEFEVEADFSKYNRHNKNFFDSIIVKPELNSFIKRKFTNLQEYDLKRTHLKTNIAIAISFIIGIISIWTSININGVNTEFWKTNELVELENHTEKMLVLEDINETNKNQLLVLEELLNRENDSEVNNTELIIEKFDEVINQNKHILEWIEDSKENVENN